MDCQQLTDNYESVGNAPERQQLLIGPIPPQAKLFVTGLGYAGEPAALKKYFEGFGEVLKTETYRSVGVAYVTFVDRETLRKVISKVAHWIPQICKTANVEMVMEGHEHGRPLTGGATGSTIVWNPNPADMDGKVTWISPLRLPDKTEEDLTPVKCHGPVAVVDSQVNDKSNGILETDFSWKPEYEPSPPGEAEPVKHPWMRAGSIGDLEYHVNPPAADANLPPPLPPPEILPPLPPIPKARYIPGYDEDGNPTEEASGSSNEEFGVPRNAVAEVLLHGYSLVPFVVLPPPQEFRDVNDPFATPVGDRPAPPRRYLNSTGTSSPRDPDAANRVERKYAFENAAAAFGKFDDVK